MALQIKNLACGKVATPAINSPLYTVPAGKSAMIASIVVTYEAGVSTRLQANIGGTRVSIGVDSTTAQTIVYSERITLYDGDKIELNFYGTLPGSASTQHCISGFERDV